MIHPLLSLLFLLPSYGGIADESIVLDPALTVRQVSPHCWIHVSDLQLDSATVVPCNGLLVVDGTEALIVDTPVHDSLSAKLMDWIRTELRAEVVGVVANHHHLDCVGGLQVFIDAGCPTYANEDTRDECIAKGTVAPSTTFVDSLNIRIGDITVVNRFLGKAHSSDNIVTYVPTDSVLFGGCMVKALGAGYGNTADADLDEWPRTIERVRSTFPHAIIVVPGHGSEGGLDLLDYTIDLFTPRD
jgi:metallo-beta-lactamase class B